jgi:hypothetical protein
VGLGLVVLVVIGLVVLIESYRRWTIATTPPKKEIGSRPFVLKLPIMITFDGFFLFKRSLMSSVWPGNIALNSSPLFQIELRRPFFTCYMLWIFAF